MCVMELLELNTKNTPSALQQWQHNSSNACHDTRDRMRVCTPKQATAEEANKNNNNFTSEA
jgi:hypothetical protein